MPMMAEFDLPSYCWVRGVSYSDPAYVKASQDAAARRREVIKHLDELVEAVVDTVPKNQWHGIIRWGQVLGKIGTPRYDDEGAVIYR
jgi:hypothetical protein